MLSAASRITLHRVFPVEYCPKSIKTTLHRMFFLCHVVWIFLGNIMQDFWLWNAVPREGFLICNVVWSLLDNIAQSFYLCNAVPRVLRQHWIKFSLSNIVWRFLDIIVQDINVVWILLGNIMQCFWLCNAVSREGFFICNVVWSLLDNIVQGLPVQCCSKKIKTTLNRIFLVQCCLEPQGRHFQRYLLVQCCHKSIKTTLSKISSCAMLTHG